MLSSSYFDPDHVCHFSIHLGYVLHSTNEHNGSFNWYVPAFYVKYYFKLKFIFLIYFVASNLSNLITAKNLKSILPSPHRTQGDGMENDIQSPQKSETAPDTSSKPSKKSLVNLLPQI